MEDYLEKRKQPMEISLGEEIRRLEVLSSSQQEPAMEDASLVFLGCKRETREMELLNMTARVLIIYSSWLV